MNFRRIFLELTAYTSACANAPYYMNLRDLLDLLMLPIKHGDAPYYILSFFGDRRVAEVLPPVFCCFSVDYTMVTGVYATF